MNTEVSQARQSIAREMDQLKVHAKAVSGVKEIITSAEGRMRSLGEARQSATERASQLSEQIRAIMLDKSADISNGLVKQSAERRVALLEVGDIDYALQEMAIEVDGIKAAAGNDVAAINTIYKSVADMYTRALIEEAVLEIRDRLAAPLAFRMRMMVDDQINHMALNEGDAIQRVMGDIYRVIADSGCFHDNFDKSALMGDEVFSELAEARKAAAGIQEITPAMRHALRSKRGGKGDE